MRRDLLKPLFFLFEGFNLHEVQRASCYNMFTRVAVHNVVCGYLQLVALQQSFRQNCSEAESGTTVCVCDASKVCIFLTQINV